MDIETLKSEHPAVYQAAFNAGMDAGQAKERDRVNAHLALASGSGDTDAAHKAIEDGSEITATVQAHHMAAAMKRAGVESREEEAPADLDGDQKPRESAAGDAAAEMKAGIEKSCNVEWEVM